MEEVGLGRNQHFQEASRSEGCHKPAIRAGVESNMFKAEGDTRAVVSVWNGPPLLWSGGGRYVNYTRTHTQSLRTRDCAVITAHSAICQPTRIFFKPAMCQVLWEEVLEIPK